ALTATEWRRPTASLPGRSELGYLFPFVGAQQNDFRRIILLASMPVPRIAIFVVAVAQSPRRIIPEGAQRGCQKRKERAELDDQQQCKPEWNGYRREQQKESPGRNAPRSRRPQMCGHGFKSRHACSPPKPEPPGP